MTAIKVPSGGPERELATRAIEDRNICKGKIEDDKVTEASRPAMAA